MKANELQLGDFVLIDNKPTCISMQDLVYIYQGLECEPILLTAEILEKNGWVFVFSESEYRSPEDIAFKESLRLQNGADGNAFWWIVGYALICPINYVHELQHALRFMGLKPLQTISKYRRNRNDTTSAKK